MSELTIATGFIHSESRYSILGPDKFGEQPLGILRNTLPTFEILTHDHETRHPTL